MAGCPRSGTGGEGRGLEVKITAADSADAESGGRAAVRWCRRCWISVSGAIWSPIAGAPTPGTPHGGGRSVGRICGATSRPGSNAGAWPKCLGKPCGDKAWRPDNRGDVTGDPPSAPGIVDLCPACRGAANTSCRRTREPSGSPLAQRELWHPECRWLPRCRSADDRGGDAQTATPSRPRLSDGRMRGRAARGRVTFLASHACPPQCQSRMRLADQE
jgi:hypothetical protein